VALSPIFGGACRFEPSCSVYAEQVLRNQSLFKALKLIVLRLLRCRPGGPYGFDPAPECGCASGK
jgi:putative membrane protein insertion efficiency factor